MASTSKKEKKMPKDSIARGNASQFFIAGELCRRGYYAVVTLGNTPNVDILVSDVGGTRFAHVQVKTFVPGKSTCTLGMKATKDFGPSFFWILGGIPAPNSQDSFVYYIIPAEDMAKNVNAAYKIWLKTLGKKGQAHKETTVRTVHLPPRKSLSGWSIEGYKNKWDLITDHLDRRPDSKNEAPATD